MHQLFSACLYLNGKVQLLTSGATVLESNSDHHRCTEDKLCRLTPTFQTQSTRLIFQVSVNLSVTATTQQTECIIWIKTCQLLTHTLIIIISSTKQIQRFSNMNSDLFSCIVAMSVLLSRPQTVSSVTTGLAQTFRAPSTEQAPRTAEELSKSE